jgi:hypothetical protein
VTSPTCGRLEVAQRVTADAEGVEVVEVAGDEDRDPFVPPGAAGLPPVARNR